MNSHNPTRREVLKYISMAPFAGLIPAAVAVVKPSLNPIPLAVAKAIVFQPGEAYLSIMSEEAARRVREAVRMTTRGPRLRRKNGKSHIASQILDQLETV